LEEQLKEQHTDEVLLVIDKLLYEFESADEDDRTSKINAFMALSNYQVYISDHDIQSEIIDTEINDALTEIVDWFFSDYTNKIDEVIEVAVENIDETRQYLSGFSAYLDEFSGIFDPVVGEPADEPTDEFTDEPGDEPTDELTDELGDEPGEEPVDEPSDEPADEPADEPSDEPADEPDEDSADDLTNDRSYRLEHYTELDNMYLLFVEDEFNSLRIDTIDAQFQVLTEIISLIEDENIVEGERLVALHGIYDSFIEEYSDVNQVATIEANYIINRFASELFYQIIWFEEHYSLLIDVVANMEREDEYDEATVNNQIEELELVKQFIEDDGVVGIDFQLLTNENIDLLIEEYQVELVAIEERIKQRDEEAAKAAAANTRNSRATSNNRTGTSNSNTSGNSSGSSNSTSGGKENQSGTGNQSGSGSTPVSGNNNYPSISANCRDILARLVRLEAPNDSADGKQAVAEVVLNRMVSSRWSHVSTVEEVVFDSKWGVQFTVKDLIWTDRGTPSASDFAAADRALSGPNVLSREYLYFNTRPVTQNDVVWIGSHAFSK